MYNRPSRHVLTLFSGNKTHKPARQSRPSNVKYPPRLQAQHRSPCIHKLQVPRYCCEVSELKRRYRQITIAKSNTLVLRIRTIHLQPRQNFLSAKANILSSSNIQLRTAQIIVQKSTPKQLVNTVQLMDDPTSCRTKLRTCYLLNYQSIISIFCAGQGNPYRTYEVWCAGFRHPSRHNTHQCHDCFEPTTETPAYAALSCLLSRVDIVRIRHRLRVEQRLHLLKGASCASVVERRSWLLTIVAIRYRLRVEQCLELLRGRSCDNTVAREVVPSNSRLLRRPRVQVARNRWQQVQVARWQQVQVVGRSTP